MKIFFPPQNKKKKFYRAPNFKYKYKNVGIKLKKNKIIRNKNYIAFLLSESHFNKNLVHPLFLLLKKSI